MSMSTIGAFSLKLDTFTQMGMAAEIKPTAIKVGEVVVIGTYSHLLYNLTERKIVELMANEDKILPVCNLNSRNVK